MSTKYIQFDWQKKKIDGTLIKLDNLKLYIASPSRKKKKVIPWIDRKGEIFIRNPYNKNWIAFLETDHFKDGDYYRLFFY